MSVVRTLVYCKWGLWNICVPGGKGFLETLNFVLYFVLVLRDTCKLNFDPRLHPLAVVIVSYCFLQVVTDHVQNTLAVQRLDLQGYMMLYVPAVDWIMQCLAYNSSEVGVVM